MLTSDVFAQQAKRPDILIADFEMESWGDWKVEGDAFGSGPALGTLPGQMPVSGFVGRRLVNSFLQGDRTTGRLTSPEFRIQRPWLNFLIGGGGHDGETCMNLLVDGKVVRTETGWNTSSGGSEELQSASWDVVELAGKMAVLQIVDQHTGGWGHINVDQITLSDTNTAPVRIAMKKTLTVDSTHLLVPVSNSAKPTLLGIFQGDNLVQSFSVALPQDGEPFWLAGYPINHFGLQGKEITLAPVDAASRIPESSRAAFDRIRTGTSADAMKADDYQQPYRDQFHVTTRRGWNNDPNGMVYHNGRYHLYYQHNPFGIDWGNMHWGHVESTDLIHWEEKPIAVFQRTVKDMAFSGSGFIDFNNSAGLGKDTLFIAFTSTGRGECLAWSKDGGLSFTEIEENPVVKHNGRDPRVLWYTPEQKWVMVIYDETACAETEAVPPASDRGLASRNFVFYESKNLRQWTRTGAFTDPDREAVFECPELFELPVEGKSGETRWIVLGAQNRYFIGRFDGKTFVKESGPHGESRGALYAAQTFSDVPDGRRIQIGWIRTTPFVSRFPDQIVSQSFTLPQELTLRDTDAGLRMFMEPVAETKRLRDKLLAEGVDGLEACAGETTEVLIEFKEDGRHELIINGIDASFTGRHARIFTDRTFNEVYSDGGLGYSATQRLPANVDSTQTVLKNGTVKSLQVYRLKSIWNK
jgi:fructan beta-fructosidase